MTGSRRPPSTLRSEAAGGSSHPSSGQSLPDRGKPGGKPGRGGRGELKVTRRHESGLHHSSAARRQLGNSVSLAMIHEIVRRGQRRMRTAKYQLRRQQSADSRTLIWRFGQDTEIISEGPIPKLKKRVVKAAKAECSGVAPRDAVSPTIRFSSSVMRVFRSMTAV